MALRDEFGHLAVAEEFAALAAADPDAFAAELARLIADPQEAAQAALAPGRSMTSSSLLAW